MPLLQRSSVVPTDPNDAWLVAKTAYQAAAILTLVVYEMLSTVDSEVKYFWEPFRWNAVTIFFIANRYVGLLGAAASLLIETYDASLPLCKFSVWSRSVAYWATIALIDYVLMARVLALYAHHFVRKTLAMCLRLLLVLATASKLGLLIYITWNQEITTYNVADGVSICGEVRTVAIGWGIADWIIPMSYGVMLMGLALYQGIHFWRTSVGFHSVNLVKVLIRDQVVYFALVVPCCVLNILQFKIHVTNEFLAGLLATLGSPSLLCIMGSRLLFNLKRAGEQGVSENSGSSVSDIEFSSHVYEN